MPNRLTLLLTTALTFAGPAYAADITWPQDDWNPRPAEGDVILPMPCGGAMAFRRVVTSKPPEGDLMDDLGIVLGWAAQDTAYIDYLRSDYLAGSFDDSASGERYYLIGKYEVTRQQMASVKEPAKCALPTDGTAGMAAGNVGWFDAVDFTRAWNAWLRTQAADALKAASSEAGVVRLPSEAEWEFAAGGGLAVPAAQRSDRMPLIEGGISAYGWSSDSDSSQGQIQLVGALAPNPLGLYDILGNVEEIMLEPFRMNRVGRLQGQTGGYIVRGGSILTSKDDLRTQLRQEMPFYTGADETRGRTTGMRVVLGAAALGSLDRATRLQKQWTANRDHLTLAGSDDPLAMLQDVLGNETDIQKRQVLGEAIAALNKELVLRQEIAGRAAKNLIFSAALVRGEMRRNREDTVRLQRIVDQNLVPERMERDKAIIARNNELFGFYSAIYVDAIQQIARDFTAPVRDAQTQALLLELTSRGQGDLGPVIGRVLRVVADYESGNVTETNALVEDAVQGASPE